VQQQESNKKAKEFQENIEADAERFFPDSCIDGGYCAAWYNYPTLRLDMVVCRYLSWKNYQATYDSSKSGIDAFGEKKTQFHWYDDLDQYKLIEFIE